MKSDQDMETQIPLGPLFAKGEVSLLPLAKGGGRDFMEPFTNRYSVIKSGILIFEL